MYLPKYQSKWINIKNIITLEPKVDKYFGMEGVFAHNIENMGHIPRVSK